MVHAAIARWRSPSREYAEPSPPNAREDRGAAGTVHADRRRGATGTRDWGLGIGQPRAGERDDRGGRPLRHDEVRRRLRLAEVIVVDVEAAAETEPRVQRERADERGGRVAGGLQQRRGRARAGGHAVAAVVTNAVLVGIQARQDAGVRRQRRDRVRVRVREVEADALRREPIERRRRRAAAVAPKRVGAQRVDRDQENVLPRNRPEVGLRRRVTGDRRQAGGRRPHARRTRHG